MRKILSKILVFTLIINTIFPTSFLSIPFGGAIGGIVGETIQDAFTEDALASSGMLQWTNNYKLSANELFVPVTRTGGEDNVYLKWDLSKSATGASITEGTYTLTYPIQDGIQIDFVVEKTGEEQASISYYVNGSNAVNGASFLVYHKDSGTYKPATKANFPFTEASDVYIDIPDDAEGGVAPNVKFFIKSGNGYAFTFGGRSVIFAWDKSTNQMLFQTNGITSGNIYPFNLNINANSSEYNEVLEIFPGINTDYGFEMQPFANGTPGSVDPDVPDMIEDALLIPTEGVRLIDQTERPITEYPGANISGVNISFDTPKRWVSNLKVDGTTGEVTNAGSFEFLEVTEEDYNAPGYEFIETTININSQNPYANMVEVEIPNIYESYHDSEKYETTKEPNIYFKNNQVAANYEYSSKKREVSSSIEEIQERVATVSTTTMAGGYTDVFSTYNPYTVVSNDILESSKVSMVIGNLTASTVYGGSEIMMDSKQFLSQSIEFKAGAIYTYPKYRIIALDESEFYVEITPYTGYNGYYVVKQGLTATTSNWALYEDTTYGASQILITVPLDSSSDQTKYFEIQFSSTPPSVIAGPDDIVSLSQTLKYKPEQEDVSFGTINNFQIVSSHILYDEDDPDYAENLFLSVKWDIGRESTVSTLAQTNNGNLLVDYQLYKGTEVNKYDEFEFAGVQLEFTEDTATDRDNIKNGIIYHSPEYKQDGNSKHLSSVIDADVKGNTSTKTFTSSRIENVGGIDRTILEANVTFKIPVSEKNVSIDKLILEYPELYLVNVGGTYTMTPHGENAMQQDRVIDKSLPDTLTLNGLSTVMVPMPQELEIIDTDETYISVIYDTLNYESPKDLLYNYNEIMLKNIGRELTQDSIYYDIYITQDKSIFDRMIVTQENDGDFRETYADYLETYDLNKKTPGEGGLGIDILGSSSNSGKNLLTTLREGGVVELFNIKQNFGLGYQELTLNGLDRNETYYVVAMTRIIPFKISNGSMLIERSDHSDFSNIVTATTLKGDNDLTDDNKIPAAPYDFVAEDLTQASANLLWNIPSEIEDLSSDGVLEYQFIKTQGYEIDDPMFLENKVAYEKVWETIPTDSKYGIKTSGSEIVKFNDTTLNFETTAAPISEYRYINFTEDRREIKDLTLSPNTIYFYYVRAVRVTDGEDQAYSVWVPLTLTTPNVEAPENLKVEYQEEFDGYTEVMISFKLPQMDLTDVGTKYQLEYAIREDLTDWSEGNIINPSDAVITVDEVTEEIKVMYKIEGLEPGTSYKLKVRIYNTELESYSMYSNEVEYRTEYDNDAGLEDEKVENWQGALSDLIEDLKNSSYWTMEDNFTSTKVYYRPQYFGDIINFTNGSLIDLDSGQENTFKQIYLPASTVVSAFNNFKGFKMTNGDMDVIIAAQSLDPNSIQAIKDVSVELARLDSDLEDYFVKVTLTYEYSLFVMENQYNTSPVVGVYFDVLTTADDIIDMDERIIGVINELAKQDKYSIDYEEDIREMIQNETENMDIARYLNETFADFKAEIAEELEYEIKDITEVVQEFTSVPKSIMITNPKEISYTYQGYKAIKVEEEDNNSNSSSSSDNDEEEEEKVEWIGTELRDYLEKKAIYTNTTGRYGFVAHHNTIENVGSLENSGTIVDIYSSYNLNNYIGYNGSVELADVMTRDAVLGTFASLAGATSGTAPTDFFASKGITISARDGSTPMTLEETIYVAMKVYEIKTGTSVDQLKVRNYNLSSGVTNINSKYKKSVQVAYDLGIASGSADARSTVSAGQLLEMSMSLSKITNI